MTGKVMGYQVSPMIAQRPTKSSSKGTGRACFLGCLIFLLALASIGCSAGKVKPQATEAQLENLIASEEWIARQTNLMPKLGYSIKNLRLPDTGARALFAESADLRGLRADGQPTPDYRLDSLGVEAYAWPLSDQPQAEPWKPFLDQISYFENAKFAIVRAKFVDSDKTEVRSDVHFEGFARAVTGKLLQVNADQELLWRKAGKSWRIVAWRQNSLATVGAARSFFRDVVDQALPQQFRSVAKGSAYEQLLRTISGEPSKYFAVHAADRHPGVAIVDIDNDGFDDFYVMDRVGKNLFFRNRGDGTFEEIAHDRGLDFVNDCSSAIFADFDNDGDSDLFLGRTLQRSLYLVNENGHFVDRSASNILTVLPFLVFSVSAADYNGDGLLDVLFSTYAQELQDASPPDDATKTWLSEFLSPEDARHLYDAPRKDGMLDMPGPPNVLLVNDGGGKFSLSPFNSQLAAWRQTSQGTWSDFDGDGDPDIYLANDFAPNLMFRNDGKAGFTDVTKQMGTADLGFGMGVSWGDYDLDGRLDLYTSNMFSKAGQRIAAQLDAIDPRVAKMSGGNSLFRNRGENFEKVSGLDSPALKVEKAGWSYGGQFSDIDNDGYLDIYALAGFYTAPADLALPIDL